MANSQHASASGPSIIKLYTNGKYKNYHQFTRVPNLQKRQRLGRSKRLATRYIKNARATIVDPAMYNEGYKGVIVKSHGQTYYMVDCFDNEPGNGQDFDGKYSNSLRLSGGYINAKDFSKHKTYNRKHKTYNRRKSHRRSTNRNLGAIHQKAKRKTWYNLNLKKAEKYYNSNLSTGYYNRGLWEPFTHSVYVESMGPREYIPYKKIPEKLFW